MPDLTPAPLPTTPRPGGLAVLLGEVVELRRRLDELAGLYARERQRADLAERRAIRAEDAERRAWRVTLRGSEVRR